MLIRQRIAGRKRLQPAASRAHHRAGIAATLVLALFAPVSATARPEPALDQAFRQPPAEARPRVWWHWLNGNVSKDGIAKDLAWMARIGIGGVQTFDINFSTPTVVDQRLIYMTPAWQDAFRFAAAEADRLGLELTVASSPGWSETGGPWVPPADGMKKLVWSVTDATADTPFTGRLASPPKVSGPFQDLPLVPEPGAEKSVPPQFYADVAVLAYPLPQVAALPSPRITLVDGTTLDDSRLNDGRFTETVALPRKPDGGEIMLLLSYDKPQTVRALNLFSSANTDMFNGSAFTAVLEAGDGWTKIAEFTPGLVPDTISFAPVTAARFRLRLVPRESQSAIDAASAPGYAGINFAQFLRGRPIQLAELRLLPEARVNRFESKAGFNVARDFYALDDGLATNDPGIAPAAVIDLTGRLRADGTLDWQPPQGNWRIVRFGMALTGKTNHPAPQEATGLEVDKLDGAAVRRYMEKYLGTYRDTVGRAWLGKRGINAILTDSTEVGAFNWTPALLGQFRKQRGYDPLPWLPALSGEIIGSRKDSDRFLYDFLRTVSSLHASEHYGTLAKVAHENGLKVYGEALEGWRVSPGDDIDMRAETDVPMGALWAFPREIGPRPLLLADLRTAASAAHIAGKRFVAAESMTSSRFPWAQAPADLRRVVDTEFANGVNRIVIHTSPHQPVDNKQPGLSLRHIGQFFTRHESWAELARPWVDYIARSSLMLQQGRNVADVAYFLGEEAPAGALVESGGLRDVPTGHGYDFVNATTILDQFRVERGSLTTKGGARYRVLYLGGSSRFMTLPVLRRINRLARDGATIIGQPPQASPSLADDPAQFAALVRQMWSGGPVTALGKGRLVESGDLAAALAGLEIAPDFALPRTVAQVDFVHRRTADADIYFVRNAAGKAATFAARFRMTGKAPEWWDAVSGTTRPLSYRIEGGQTVVPLALGAEDSGFVVFRKPATAAARDVPEPVFAPISRIEADWTVAFQPGRGAPATITLPRLVPLNELADPGVRFFSGMATYSTAFTAPANLGTPLLLDLGQVGDLAEVRINGVLVGTLWAAPYRIDITPLVRPGSNTLEVRVADLWHNRLVGDAQRGASKIAWTSSPMYKADTPLRPAGLIGPVTLQGISP